MFECQAIRGLTVCSHVQKKPSKTLSNMPSTDLIFMKMKIKALVLLEGQWQTGKKTKFGPSTLAAISHKNRAFIMLL